ncbi:MAG: type VI secretion system accessory protein TagJ [Pseudomonadota bacterium]
MTRKAADAALAAGNLEDCRTALFDAVRAAPDDPELRAFLFQYLCLVGDWERADKQLDVLGEMTPASLDMVNDYRTAIRAEMVREAVWAGEISPPIFGEPRDWMAKLVQAQAHEARGETGPAHDLRAEALAEAPAEPGLLNGTRFAWFADADTRLGPVFEMIINGEYHWIAMADVARLELHAPKNVRDLVWAVCILTLTNGASLPVFMPARYPGAAQSGDAGLILGRRTEWTALAGEHAAGHGQRLFATDTGDLPALELRDLSFDNAVAALAEQAALEADGDG